MKKLFIALINFGIKPETSPKITEEIRLLNAVSLLGAFVCPPYILLFAVTGNNTLALAFLIGSVLFSLPFLINKWFGVVAGRVFIAIMASLFFGVVSVLSGKDAGFYLGFLVVSVPPIFFYANNSCGTASG